MIRRSQIEPPVVPSRWGEEERRYARQLEELLERMSARVEALQAEIKNLKKAVENK